MSKLLVPAGFILLLTALEPVYSKNLKEQWSYCQKDEDCVVVYRACRHISINKTYADKYEDPEVIFCNALIDNRYEQFHSRCLKNRCSLERRKSEE